MEGFLFFGDSLFFFRVQDTTSKRWAGCYSGGYRRAGHPYRTGSCTKNFPADRHGFMEKGCYPCSGGYRSRLSFQPTRSFRSAQSQSLNDMLEVIIFYQGIGHLIGLLIGLLIVTTGKRSTPSSKP